MIFNNKLNYFLKFRNFKKVDQELKRYLEIVRNILPEHDIQLLYILDQFKKYYVLMGNSYEHTKLLKEMLKIAIFNE
jgi:pyruvate-formate lyase-activating enzyme